MALQIVFLVLGAVIMYLAYEKITYERNLKASRGKVWARFYNEIGESYDVMCPVNGNILMAPSHALEKLRGKEGLENADYIVTPDNTYSMPWPPGKRERMQVKVHHTCYYEGQSSPIITRSIEKRANPSVAFTPEMVANMRNEKFTELAVKSIAGAAENLRKIEQAMGLNPRITQMVAIAMVAVAGYGAWRAHEAVMLLYRVLRTVGG